MVALEQATESFVNDDVAVTVRRRAIDQFVPESLVRPVRMVMSDVLAKGAREMGLAEQDQL